MENLFNAIFIPTCIFCKSTGSVFCLRCLAKCSVINEGFCVVCERRSLDGLTHLSCCNPSTPLQIFASYKYEGLVQQCIKKSKYGPKYFASLKRLINSAVTYASKCGSDWKDFVVVPIPLSKNRYRERGFNQAELIGLEICKQFGLKMDLAILNRQKETRVQFASNRVERFKNMSQAFAADQKRVSGKKILLVDDICTSGATLLEASKCLHAANCDQIKCFTLARRL